MRRRRILPLTLLPLLGAGPARALDSPAAPVVLTLSGRIGAVNRPGGLDFDMAMLERLPQAGYLARTPWFGASRKFSGPLLRDLLALAGCQGRELRAFALNDYRVDLPVDDARRYDVIVARLLDDRPMAVRDKGPLMIMYPFDGHPELRDAVHYGRCAWQLRGIEVL